MLQNLRESFCKVCEELSWTLYSHTLSVEKGNEDKRYGIRLAMNASFLNMISVWKQCISMPCLTVCHTGRTGARS